MGDNRKLTRGRRRPFAGRGHRGFGVTCHRCEQAEQLEVRANELALLIKTATSTFPTYLTVEKDTVTIKGGGKSFHGHVTGKLTVNSVVAQLCHTMREFSNHLRPKTLGSSSS